MLFNKLNKRLLELDDRVAVLEMEHKEMTNKLKQMSAELYKRRVVKPMRYEDYAMERRDIGRIDKLNTLTNPDTFWQDVRKFTKTVKGDHALKRWQILAETRYEQLTS